MEPDTNQTNQCTEKPEMIPRTFISRETSSGSDDLILQIVDAASGNVAPSLFVNYIDQFSELTN